MKLALLLALPLVGCLPAVGDDLDGDGWIWSEDCDDLDPAVHPEAEDDPCDGVDTNCDGAPEGDLDGDGFAPLACGGADCDDDDAGIHPGAEDIACDGIDQDCSGADNGDMDGDGVHGEACDGDDCDDSDPTVYPGALEALDGEDDDCDGEFDELPWDDGPWDASAIHGGLHGQAGTTGGLGEIIAPTALDAVGPSDLDDDDFTPNPDGLGDLLVAAPVGVPAVYVVPGGDASLLALDDVIERTALRFNSGGVVNFGQALAWVPDLDGDAVPEVAIGAPSADGGSSLGHAYLFASSAWSAAREGPSGERELTTADASLMLEADENGDGFGRLTALADVADGDGPWLAIGAPSANAVGTLNTRYLGEIDLFDAATLRQPGTRHPDDAPVRITGTEDHEFVGYAPVVALDMDGSGLADLVVSAPGANLDDGLIGILHGEDLTAATLDILDLDHQIKGGDLRRVGLALAPGGDMNADGYDDLAMLCSNAAMTAPAVTVLSGDLWRMRETGSTNDTYLLTVFWKDTAILADDPQIALNGSFNGDEYADLAMGAPGAPIETGDGPVLVYYGGPGVGGQQDTAQSDASLYGPEGSDFGSASVTALALSDGGLPFLVVGAPTDGHGPDETRPPGTVFVLDPWSRW
jgi:hypothetical protein